MIVYKKDDLHFDNEQSIHMSFKLYEENGYSLDVDSLLISSQPYI